MLAGITLKFDNHCVHMQFKVLIRCITNFISGMLAILLSTLEKKKTKVKFKKLLTV